MISSAVPERASLMMIEGGLTAIAIATAFAFPEIGSAFFSRIEHLFGRLARKQGLAVAVVGFSAILLRLAILPVAHIPHPFVNDDFSFLLAADTFAHGRLTNPTPAMWTHFESIQITMKPTYMSMYFPANGLVLAAGKMLFGHPWFGLLCMMGLMCAGITWMLQAWLPPTWALLGGMLAVLRLGLFSYWINTYTGAGSVSALGGALVLGALPRLMKTPRLRYSLLMAMGAVLLALSRPYEGLLLCLPAVVLGRWALANHSRPTRPHLLRLAALPMLLIVAAVAWMGYYDYRAFGNPLTPPYKIDRATYAVAPYYVWQSPRPVPVYRHKAMRDFYCNDELTIFEKIHRASGFVPCTLLKGLRGVLFFAGLALLPPLIMSRRVLHDRRLRFLLICLAVLMVGMAIEIFFIPHYIAPFTAVFYALGLQAIRHLRVWRPEGRAVGLGLVRLIVALCCVLGVLRLLEAPLHLRRVQEWPASSWVGWWSGPDNFGIARSQIENELERLPGKQLVIVRYAPDHDSLYEWVYNAADIDSSKVIWAREMDAASNLDLIHYYKNRNVWLVQPDLQPAGLSPYPLPETNAAPTPDSMSAAKNEKKAQQGG